MKLVYALSLLLFSLTWNHVNAQEPTLAPSNLDFTRKIIAKFHYVAWVTLETQENQFTRFQYDHYPDTGPDTEAERVKFDEGTFARRKSKAWLKSDDWGKTGSPVSADLAQKLDMDVSVVTNAFAQLKSLDPTQGGTVWKFIDQSKDKDFTYYTYERSREHPHPNGEYPRFTFMKAADDTDGHLFLCKMTAQLISSDAKRIPVAIKLNYLVPLPANTKVQIYDQATGKMKYETVSGKNSGWEMNALQSAPPKNP